MLRVGLTGGIGSGKSTVAQRFSALGAIVVDADVLAREVVAPGSDGLRLVVERFGPGVVSRQGALDRAALGALVFADPQARRDLEGITHPLIARRTGELFAAAPEDAVVVHDVPLLVEKHMGPGYHLVVVVDADEQVRLDRLVGARGMDVEDARRRIAAQASEGERRAAADVWLDNGGTEAELEAAVDRLWHERLVPFELNVRTGVRAARSDDLRPVPSDPSWPAQAERLLQRLRLAFGDIVVTADHVGSTSVPGLLAKDVIDLQVGVASLDAADEPALVQRLRDAGFPRTGTVAFDNAKVGSAWEKRFHAGADPGRLVHVHVRQVGSPGWRWALAFRDWMRADRAAREEYAAEKQRLAASGLGVDAYAEAKEPWFDAVHARVEEWVRVSGWAPVRR
ncbi:dephospho-CoA kinase [Pedococcus sp. NPDC057267]|uniref:dephospho-CoA kinase n=1 Tax=Pedococcus sp. NPDC057267 TaxID=3346077 RepID=UPI003634D6A5